MGFPSLLGALGPPVIPEDGPGHDFPSLSGLLGFISMRCALWTPLLDSFVLSLTFPVALLGTYRVEGGTSSCHEVMELTARVRASRLPLILLLKLSFYSDWSSWPSLQRRAQGGSMPQAWVLAVPHRSLFGGKGRVPGTPQCCMKEYPAGWKLCEENPSCDQKAVTSVFGFEITGGITHAKKKPTQTPFFWPCKSSFVH